MFLKLSRFWLFSLLAIATLTLTTLPSCTPIPPAPLRIGTIIWPGYEFLYLARDLGYYDDTAIQLIEFPSSTEVKRAYRNNDLEGGALTLDEAIDLKASNPDLKVILVADVSQGGDVILGKPELTQLSDLKGRRVGVESTALGAYVLTRALEQAQLVLTDIEVVPLTASEQAGAFQQGLIDAVVTFEPLRSQLLKSGATLLFDSTQIPGEIVDVLTVRESVLTDQPETLQALVDGWFRAYDYFQANPEDGAARMASREGITPAEFLASLELLHIPDLAENHQLFTTPEGSLLPTAQQLLTVMTTNGLLTQAVDLESLFDATAIAAVPE